MYLRCLNIRIFSVVCQYICCYFTECLQKGGAAIMSLFNNIQNLCFTKNMYISNLEKELEFSNGSMYKWGVNTPSIDKVLKVAKYFGVSVDSLIEENDVDLITDINTLTSELVDTEQQIQQNSVKVRSIKQHLKRLQKLEGA